MTGSTPVRLTLALERLALTGSESVLEVGCGRGVAVSLVCPLLNEGRIVAIDRSATAIAAATRRNERWVETGTAAFHESDVETFDGKAHAFDVIFAVNVNVFWLKAAPALAAVRRLLASGGRLVLVYEAPSASQAAKIRDVLAAKLAAEKFAVTGTELVEKTRLLSVTAKPAN